MYMGVSSCNLGGGCQSLGGLFKWSVTHQNNLGHPLKEMTSPVAVFGSPFRQISEVNATVTAQEPSRKPICCEPASYYTLAIRNTIQMQMYRLQPIQQVDSTTTKRILQIAKHFPVNYYYYYE